MCVCNECFFGTRCQLSTKGLGSSLDAIIGYQIQTHTRFNAQPFSVKLTMIITMLILAFGLINGFLVFVTFYSQQHRNTGCCIYLFASSISSCLITVMFTLKFWILLFSQMSLIMNWSFLSIQCVSIDFLLRIFSTMNNWFNACVAVERAMTLSQGVRFNKNKSKQAAKWVLLGLSLFIILTSIHEPIYRRLIEDIEEQRIWYVVIYSKSFDIYNNTMHLFHFLLPFLINIISAIFIIITLARQRAVSRRHLSYRELFRRELQQHKHLLVSPLALVIIALPRLIIAFSSACMNSARDPWLFLSGYYISLIPSMVTFFIFIIPSSMYKNQFLQSLSRIR